MGLLSGYLCSIASASNFLCKKAKGTRKDGYLKQGRHYLQTGDTPISPILWDIAELEKLFASSQPRRES